MPESLAGDQRSRCELVCSTFVGAVLALPAMLGWNRFIIVAGGWSVMGDDSCGAAVDAVASDCGNRGAALVAHAVCGDLA